MCVSIFSHVSFNKINYFLRQFPCVVHFSAGGEGCLSRSLAIILLNAIRFNFVFFSLASISLGNGKTLKVRRARKEEKKLNLISPNGLRLWGWIDGPDAGRRCDKHRTKFSHLLLSPFWTSTKHNRKVRGESLLFSQVFLLPFNKTSFFCSRRNARREICLNNFPSFRSFLT